MWRVRWSLWRLNVFNASQCQLQPEPLAFILHIYIYNINLVDLEKTWKLHNVLLRCQFTMVSVPLHSNNNINVGMKRTKHTQTDKASAQLSVMPILLLS